MSHDKRRREPTELNVTRQLPLTDAVSQLYRNAVLTTERLAPSYFKQGFVRPGHALPLSFLLDELMSAAPAANSRTSTIEIICRALQREGLVSTYRTNGAVHPYILPAFQRHLFVLPPESLIKSMMRSLQPGYSHPASAKAQAAAYRAVSGEAAERQKPSPQQLPLL